MIQCFDGEGIDMNANPCRLDVLATVAIHEDGRCLVLRFERASHFERAQRKFDALHKRMVEIHVHVSPKKKRPPVFVGRLHGHARDGDSLDMALDLRGEA